MAIIPTIMNSFQFWIQDNFLKKQISAEDDPEIRSFFYETNKIELSPVKSPVEV